MSVSVIVCTCNRAESLRKALESLSRSELPQSLEWEVLVVDNNSTDQTREVTKDFCMRDPAHFRYVFEPRPGKSHALNRGVTEARGEVLAFTDDDVQVEPKWLGNLTVNLNNGKWAGASGRTLPQQPYRAPHWIPRSPRHALAPLAIFDPPIPAGPLAEPPYGVNMAYQRSVFEKYGGFRVDLGPGAGVGIPQKSEDSEFGTRVIAGGEQLRYEPSAVLYHAVPPGRLKKRYFLDWWFDKARADIRAGGIHLKTRWTLAGIPLRLFVRMFKWALAWLTSFSPARRFDYKIRVWVLWGEIVECYRVTHSPSI
jgi:glycosyltransferase involved in cell wall biosynthesis